MIRFSILGPGRISHRFLKGCQYVKEAQVLSFASRNIKKAQEYADLSNISKVYSYDELYQDKDIDAVYISTPPFVHYQQIKACLLANKHVLCEKPLCETPQQAQELFELAAKKHLLLMEAQKEVFLPSYKRIQDILKNSDIGEPIMAQAGFTRDYGNLPNDHWVFTMPCGGCMYDIGVYPLTELLSLFPSKKLDINRLDVYGEFYPKTSLVIMRNENNFLMTAKCSMAYEADNELEIFCKNGTILFKDYWKGHTVETWIGSKHKCYNDSFESEFTFEIQHFCDCIQNHLSQSPILRNDITIQVLGIVANANPKR